MSVRTFGIIGFVLGGALSIAITTGYITTVIFLLTVLTSASIMVVLQATHAALRLRITAMTAVCLIGATAHVFVQKAPMTDVAAVANVQSSDVMRAFDGQFRATADVNGGEIEMLFDTGASIVLLTHKDALAVGLDPDTLRFKLPILTANGKSHVAPVTLEQVRIGNVAVQNVRAAVAKPGQLHASLLGTSFIGEIEEAVIRKDRLILRN